MDCGESTKEGGNEEGEGEKSTVIRVRMMG